MGGEVTFLTCIGQDSDGQACMDFLEKEGITPCPQVCPEVPSAYACILTDREGENRVTVFRGAAERLTAQFVAEQEQVIAHSGMVLLNNEYPQECNEMAMALAKKHGVKVLYNPAPARAVSREFLEGCFLVTPNLSETAVLAGETTEDLSRLGQLLHRAGIRQAVVTLGGDGALLVTQEKVCRFPARKVRAADTTGAGDTFTGALAVAVLEGKCLEEAVQWAVNASALSVAQQYVMPGLPTREALDEAFQPVEPVMISFGR